VKGRRRSGMRRRRLVVGRSRLEISLNLNECRLS
jgi:hypothetical protein